MAAHVPSRLYRSRSQKMIAGVCGGLGEYFDVDPVLIRLMFVVTTFISGAGILAYIILWIVVPFEGDSTDRMDALRRDFDDLTGRVREYIDPPRAGATAGGPAAPGQSGPDVTGYHGGFGAGPYGPGPHAESTAETDPNLRGGASSAASPFETSRDASMTSDTATARVPGSDAPSAAPSGSESVEASPPTAGEERGEAPVSASVAAEPPSADTDDDPFKIDPPTGPQAGAAPGTPPFGSPYGSTPGTPPPGPSFGAPAGGSASTYGWTSAPRESGTASGAPFVPPAAAPSDRKRRRQHWAGAILILIGVLILGNNLGLLWWLEFEYFLPLVLVGLGAWLLFGRGRRG